MHLWWLLWGLLPFLLGTTWTWDAVTTDTAGNTLTVDSYTVALSTDGGATFTPLTCIEQDSDPNLLGLLCTPSETPPDGACFHATATNAWGTSGPSNVAGGCVIPIQRKHRS